MKAPESTIATLAELGAQYDHVMHRCSRAFLLAALKAHGGNTSETARAIGVHRNTLYRHMKRAGIPTPLQRKQRAANLPPKKLSARVTFGYGRERVA